MPETMDETVKVIQLMLQVQIRGRIVEGIADVCVPQLMEERSEDQKSNPQMQVRNRTAKQTLDPTVQQILGEFVVIQPLLEEPAVKVAKAIPQERVHMMTSRQVPGAQTVQKTFENQQKQSVDMVVNMPVAAEHQVSTVQRAQTVEVLKVFIDNVVDVRVMQRLVSIQSTQEAVEVPRVQFTDKMVDEPAVVQG